MKKLLSVLLMAFALSCAVPESAVMDRYTDLAGCTGSGGARTGGRAGAGGARTGGRSGSGGANTGGAATGGASTGGARTGGASGGASSGGASVGGAIGTGGAAVGGAGGVVASNILWRDSLQAGGVRDWGFDGLEIERNDVVISGSDAQGANLSRVADPLGSAGFALRHLCTFDHMGCRAQAGVWGFANTIFGNQAKRPEGIWVAQEWYFPVALTAGGDDVPWVNVWDWHSTDNVEGGRRWHTSPGLMLHEDGSMRARWEWGGDSEPLNRDSSWSTVPLPVGRWFDIEMHYRWATVGVTLELWIDGQLVLTQANAVTKRSSHTVVEMYSKWYGSQNGGARPWAPAPALRYTRNVRIANGRIWPQR